MLEFTVMEMDNRCWLVSHLMFGICIFLTVAGIISWMFQRGELSRTAIAYAQVSKSRLASTYYVTNERIWTDNHFVDVVTTVGITQ